MKTEKDKKKQSKAKKEDKVIQKLLKHDAEKQCKLEAQQGYQQAMDEARDGLAIFMSSQKDNNLGFNDGGFAMGDDQLGQFGEMGNDGQMNGLNGPF